MRTTDVEESGNFSPLRGRVLSPAQQPSILSDSSLPGTWVQVPSSASLLPALPQILPIELALFCPCHEPRRFTTVHSPWSVGQSAFLSSQSGTDCQVPFCLDYQSINAMTGAREADAHLRDAELDVDLGNQRKP